MYSVFCVHSVAAAAFFMCLEACILWHSMQGVLPLLSHTMLDVCSSYMTEGHAPCQSLTAVWDLSICHEVRARSSALYFDMSSFTVIGQA